MKIRNTSLILLLLFINTSCVTQNAQKIQNGNSNSTQKNETPTIQDSALPSQIKNELSYEPTIVELEGKLTVRTYYGPPNYGENPKTDKKENQWVLMLSDPIDVIGNRDAHDDLHSVSVRNITEVQLVLLGVHNNLIGKNVCVKGTLFHGFTGHHHTDVLMDVQSINLKN